MGTITTAIYNNLEVMPIYNFYKCSEGKMQYIYKDREGEITDELQSIWHEMYNNYHELTATHNNTNYYNLVLEVQWLRNRLIYTPLLINVALKTPPEDREKIYKELRVWKLQVYNDEDLNKALDILNNSKTKLKRKEEEIEEHIKNNEKLKSANISLEKQSIKLQRQLGVTPDIFKDSVIKWLAYFDELAELNKK